jgi:glycosyltransferase involved in cell wall biosynthesis
MTDKPLVSILIPVYNREQYIEETVRSAASQTYSPLEIIVVDNCSTDNTWKIVERLAGEDRRIRCFRNSENIGPVRNWIAAAGHATGEYCKILWSDDLMSPAFVALAVDAFLRHEDLAFVYSSVEFINDNGAVIGKPFFKLGSTGLHATERFVRQSLVDDPRFPLSPGCALFRTADIRNNLLPDFPNRHDFDLANIAIGNDLLLYLLSTLDRGRFYLLPGVHNYFRIHSGSISLTEGSGRLYAFYKLAKCFFAATHVKRGRDRLVSDMNAQIWYYLKKHKIRPAGFASISDFYPPGYQAGTTVSAASIVSMVVRELANKLRSPRNPAKAALPQSKSRTPHRPGHTGHNGDGRHDNIPDGQA